MDFNPYGPSLSIVELGCEKLKMIKHGLTQVKKDNSSKER